MSSSTAYTGTDNLEVMSAAHRYNAFLESLITKHAPSSGAVLDFGAGTGTYAAMVATQTRVVVCVEPDPDLRTSLAQNGYETHASLDALANDSCDFIYSLNVLEHIEDDGEAACELFRVLKPGGEGLIYVPALQVLYSAMDRKVGHHRRYNLKMLKGVLRRAGFTIVMAKYADSLGFFATLAYKWFGNDDGSISPKGLIVYDRIIFPLSRFLDVITHPFFGKNAFALVRKPAGN